MESTPKAKTPHEVEAELAELEAEQRARAAQREEEGDFPSVNGWSGSGEIGDPWVKERRDVGNSRYQIERYMGQCTYLAAHFGGGQRAVSMDGVPEARQDELLAEVAAKAEEIEGLTGEALIEAIGQILDEKHGDRNSSIIWGSLSDKSDSWLRHTAMESYMDIVKKKT